MSIKSGKKIRSRFYAAGNIKCPICLAPFTETEVEAGETVTLEHVPPKALGGKPLCLTCTKCNSNAGYGVDQAATMLTREPKATIEIMGKLETIYLAGADSSGLLGTVTSPRHRPEQLREWLKTKPSMTLTVTTPKQEYAAVSWLKSAYLSVFSLLGSTAGYQYVESKGLKIVRQQILDPHSPVIRSFWLRCPESPLDEGITLVRDPFLCWCVKIKDSIVLLPRGGDDSFYDSVGALIECAGTACDPQKRKPARSLRTWQV